MSQEKLVIPKKKYKGATTVVSARLPEDMVRDLDKAAEDTGHNRNEVITICLEYALQNLDSPSEESGENK